MMQKCKQAEKGRVRYIFIFMLKVDSGKANSYMVGKNKQKEKFSGCMFFLPQLAERREDDSRKKSST